DPIAYEVAQATTADTVAPADVADDEASKVVEEEVIKTTEVVDEVVQIARAAAASVIVEEDQKHKADICVSFQKLAKKMSLVVKDVDTLARIIKENIPMSIKANTDYMENKFYEASEDVKTCFKLMETKLKMTELVLSINFSMKLAKAEENLGLKIDENSTRLSSIEETL
ncbi:hypothetical protein Dimus_026789, partial [Dionaea muscipula]